MKISLKPKHLKRYKDIALLLIKYGRSDVVKHAGLHDALELDTAVEATGGASNADELAQDLEKMGPTFIKLGQLLSTRADFLPPAYIHALTRLQDQIDPFPFEQVEAIVSGELGVRISKAFAAFVEKPLATASLGQVHHATMHDGRAVVVKVQRPGIREIIAEDMEVLEEIAAFLDKHTPWGKRYEFGKMLEELRRSLWRELDYRQEARNLSTLGANLREFPRIIVPEPIEDFTTSRVLTMEFISGKKIKQLTKDHSYVQSLMDSKIISRLDLLFIVIELFFITHMIMGFLAGSEVQINAANLFLGGQFTVPFFVFVIVLGLLFPALLEILELIGYKVPIVIPAVLILFGGLIFRFIMVEAGQITRYLY